MSKGVLLLAVIVCSHCFLVNGLTAQKRRGQQIRSRSDVQPTEAPVNEEDQEELIDEGVEVDGDREVPIIKQINRVNDDGTYTFGYEAADGSFKIETRDVLGNVKGMFGFIDKNGELKRVSYSASNATGFSASGNLRSLPPESVTRRPVLVYRGTTPVIQHIPRSTSTTASTPFYDFGRRNREYESTTTTETPKPVKVLVGRRPSVAAALRENNLIRRQLGLDRSQDSHDVYSSGSIPQRPLPRGFRLPQTAQDQRVAYRNMLLEENNLKPDYPQPAPVRQRYYAPQPDEDEAYPEVPAVVPMVDRVLGAKRAFRPQAPLPAMVDPNGYPAQQQVPRRSLGRPGGYPGGYPGVYPGGYPGSYPGGYPGGYSGRAGVPQPYDPNYPPLDYEALREEIMNYLLQYLQYRTRRPPYAPLPPPAPAQGYYPQLPGGYPDYYDPQGALPPVPPVNPRYYPLEARFPPGPGGLPPYGPPVTPAAYPFVGPNVQYSDGGDVSPSTTVKPQNPTPQASERILNLKERMDSSDHRDAADTRPPSPALIRMLLARPSNYRPTVRSVEILGTSASEPISVSTTVAPSSTTRRSTTTEAADEMIASA